MPQPVPSAPGGCRQGLKTPFGAVHGGIFSCSSEEAWGHVADDELGEEAEPNICFSAKQSCSLQVTLNTCHQQHTWKIHSAVRIIKPTHLAGVGEASPPQWFVTVIAQRTCNKDLCKRSSAEISISRAPCKRRIRDHACLWEYLIQDNRAPNEQKKETDYPTCIWTEGILIDAVTLGWSVFLL